MKQPSFVFLVLGGLIGSIGTLRLIGSIRRGYHSPILTILTIFPILLINPIYPISINLNKRTKFVVRSREMWYIGKVIAMG